MESFKKENPDNQPPEVQAEPKPEAVVPIQSVPEEKKVISPVDQPIVHEEHAHMSAAQQYLLDFSRKQRGSNEKLYARLIEEGRGDDARYLAQTDSVPTNVEREVGTLLSNINRYWSDTAGEYALGKIFSQANSEMVQHWLALCAVYCESISDIEEKHLFAEQIFGLRSLVRPEYFDKYGDLYFNDLLPGGFVNFINQRRSQRVAVDSVQQTHQSDKNPKMPWWKKLFS